MNFYGSDDIFLALLGVVKVFQRFVERRREVDCG